MSVRNDRRRDFIFAEVDDNVVLDQSYKMKVNTFRYPTKRSNIKRLLVNNSHTKIRFIPPQKLFC